MTQKQYNAMIAKAYLKQTKQLEKERKKLTKEHEEYLQRDIEEIYSALICVLFDKGYKRNRIIDIVNLISKEWNYHVTHKDERGDISMADYCRKHTDIDIRDVMYIE